MNWNRVLNVVSALGAATAGQSALFDLVPDQHKAKVAAAGALVTFVAQGFAHKWTVPTPTPPGAGKILGLQV